MRIVAKNCAQSGKNNGTKFLGDVENFFAKFSTSFPTTQSSISICPIHEMLCRLTAAHAGIGDALLLKRYAARADARSDL